jgi:hypothetical protein
MGIKVCGHAVRIKRPIKIYTLFKAISLVLAICAVIVPQSFAADSSRTPSKSSSCDVASCTPLQETSTDNAAPATNSPPHKAQRTAGNHTVVSPALALAMALGYRNIQGPIVRTKQIAIRQAPRVNIVSQDRILPNDTGNKKLSMNAAAVRIAIDD